MIKDLTDPKAYPEKTTNVKLIQTHISSVFICDKYVYKIKKQVNFGFLDFSTLEKRNFYCRKEVELNNRFSEGVYIGVYPVTFDGIRHSVNGKGEIVDYAVKMKRISDEDLLKTRFRSKTLEKDDIKRIAKAIASFHKNALKSDEIDDFGKLKVIKFNTDENFDQTAEFIGHSISKEQFDSIKNWTLDFYKNNKELFKERIKNGNIRDCHGDLHMEHICLTDPIIIFDCIEFNDRFRYSDIFSDIAFLLMDLEFNNGWDFSEKLLNDYLLYSSIDNDDMTNLLIRFYKVYRAYVRGKVTSFILKDPNLSEDKKNKAKETAQKYFALAHDYTTE